MIELADMVKLDELFHISKRMRKIEPDSMVGVMKLGLLGNSGLGYLSPLV
jgi:hypothetical protein